MSLGCRRQTDLVHDEKELITGKKMFFVHFLAKEKLLKTFIQFAVLV